MFFYAFGKGSGTITYSRLNKPHCCGNVLLTSLIGMIRWHWLPSWLAKQR